MKLYHQTKKNIIIKLKKSSKVLALSTGVVISLFKNNCFNLSKVKAFSGKNSINSILSDNEVSGQNFEIIENDNQYIVSLEFSKESLEENVKENIIEKVNILDECIDDNKDIVLKISCDEILRSVNEVINIIPKNERVKALYINNLNETSQPISFTNILSTKIMKKFPNLKELSIMPYKIEVGALEKMTSLESLTIAPCKNNYNAHIATNFNELTFLSELNIIDNLSNIPIYLTTENYEILKDNNIKVNFNSCDAKQMSNVEYFYISGELDRIIKELNLNYENTTLEKVNAISCYVMENLKYDPEIAKGNRENRDWYYSQGDLYPVFYPKGDERIGICGTYAALTKALMNRVCTHDICDTVISENHAWNTILLDDKIYYLDTTWMDNQKASVTIKNAYADGIHYTQVTMPIVNALKYYGFADMNWYMNSKENMESVDINNCHSLIGDSYWDKIYNEEASLKDINVLEIKIEEALIKVLLNKNKIIKETFVTVELLLILIYILKKEKNRKRIETKELYDTYCENYKLESTDLITSSEYARLFSYLDSLLEINKNSVNMIKIQENKYALEKLKQEIINGRKLDKHFIKEETEKNQYFYETYDASKILNYVLENMEVLKKHIKTEYMYIFNIFVNQEGKIKDIETILADPNFQKLDYKIRMAFLNNNQMYKENCENNICNSK